MGGASSRRLGATSLVVALLSVLATSAAARPTPACRPPAGEGFATSCRVAVPLDRSGALPGTINLRVRVEDSLDGQPAGTILVLAGGPGQAAVPLLSQLGSSLPDWIRRTRRVVAFDQRGTGRSGQLRCPNLNPIAEDGALGAADAVQRAVAACASRLGPARSHYATTDSVADIEAVRSALGVDRLALYGTSYGTKVVLDYAAAHPEHVSRLLLDSVVPPEGADPFMRSTLAEIPRVMRSVCANGGCPFTRDAGADVAALAARLASGPLRGRVVDGRGRARPAAIDRVELFSLLLAGDFDPLRRASTPAAVRAAVEGDPALLLRLAEIPGIGLSEADGDSLALYLATTCADGAVSWAPGTPLGERSAATAAALAAIPPAQLAPFDAATVRAFGFADLCRAWPEAPVVQPRGSLPDVPALILSGEGDLRTPRADALALAARLPRAYVLGVPHTAHSVAGTADGKCVPAAITAFFADRSVRACRREGRDDSFFGPAGMPPRNLRALPAVPGVPPRVGRTLTAVGHSTSVVIQDLLAQLLWLFTAPDARELRVGGLRGGSAALSQNGLRLRRYSYVPGVALSAGIADDGEDTPDAPLLVHVSGRDAARGWVRLGERWTTGRLGGTRIRVRSDALLPSGAGAAAARVAKAGAPAPPLPPLPGSLRALLSLG